MKKQFVAKLIVLGMVLAMLPVSAMAAQQRAITWDDNGIYTDSATGDVWWFDEAGNQIYRPVYDTDYDYVGTVTPSAPATPTEPEAEPVPVETATNAAGQVVATATITVDASAATAEVPAAAIESLIAQLADANVNAVVLSAATKAPVSYPAASLVALAAATGADVVVGNAVATATVSAEAVAAVFANATSVQVAPAVNEDGTFTIALLVDGNAVDIEKIPGGLAVELTVSVTAEQVTGVYLVKADGTEAALEYTIVNGKLATTLTANGTIRIANA